MDVALASEVVVSSVNRRKYKRLIAQYKNQILQFILNPLKVAQELEGRQVISKFDLQYIESLKLHKWQNEVLYEFFLRSDYDQLLRVKGALKDESFRIQQIFQSIHERGHALMKNVLMKSPDPRLGCRSSLSIPWAFDAQVVVTSRLTQLMDTAKQRDVSGLITIFQELTSLEMIPTWIDEQNGLTPLHVAVMEGDSNVVFVKHLIELMSFLCDSHSHSNETIKKFVSSRSRRIRNVEDFINFQDTRGNSALHMAAETQAVAIAKFLYERKADLTLHNKEKVTPLEIMYETIPEVIVHILNGALPSFVTTDGKSEFILDMLAITGQPRPEPEVTINRKSESYIETQLLANMVLGNMTHSCKLILPKLLVKTFLDEKWKRLFGHIFILTMFYISVHILHTYFLIHVFIINHPYTNLNQTVKQNGGGDNIHEFYTYLLGNWESPHELKNMTTPTSLFTQALAILSATTGLIIFLIELMEMLITAICISSKVKTRRRKYGYSRSASKRKIILSFLIIFTALYSRATIPLLFGSTLLPLCIYDWNMKKNNFHHVLKPSKKQQESPPNNIKEELKRAKNKLKSARTFVTFFQVIRIMVSITIFIFSFPLLPHEFHREAAWATAILAAIMILIEMTSFVVAKVGRLKCSCYCKQGPEVKVTENSTLFNNSVYEGPEVTVRIVKCMPCRCKRMWQIFNGIFSYSENLENILQLIYSVMMTILSVWVYLGRFTNWLYITASFSVVLAWILILLQISNIYGLGKYIHMLRTVVKSFLGVIGIYGSLLLAFSVGFTIMFPQEIYFTTLPSSFFRVVAMMVGELNFDEMFHKENESFDSRPFPYASQWIHVGFIILVSMVLVNLLIGLTVSDIQKIQDKSDVIRRSVQAERIYITEKFLQFIHWLFANCKCGKINFSSTFVIKQKGSSLLSICLNEMSGDIRKEFQSLRLANQRDESDVDEPDGTEFEVLMAGFSSKLNKQILTLIANSDTQVSLPLHWFPALTIKTNERDKMRGKLIGMAQKKIKSINYKNRLAPTEKNSKLLEIFLSTCAPMPLKELKMSLRSAMKREPIGTWADCRRNLLEILRAKGDLLVKLQIEPFDIPSQMEIPIFEKLTYLTLDVGKLVPVTESTKVEEVQLFPNDYNFNERFPHVTSLEIFGLSAGFQTENFFVPHTTFNNVTHLQLRDEKSGISVQSFEKIVRLFRNLYKLGVGDTPGWLREYLPVIWGHCPDLKKLLIEIKLTSKNSFTEGHLLDKFFTGVEKNTLDITTMKELKLLKVVFKGDMKDEKIKPILSPRVVSHGFDLLSDLTVVFEISVDCPVASKEKIQQLIQPILHKFEDKGNCNYVYKSLMATI